jgi:hypothetical protein
VRRREFITLVSGVILACPVVARAQQQRTVCQSLDSCTMGPPTAPLSNESCFTPRTERSGGLSVSSIVNFDRTRSTRSPVCLQTQDRTAFHC